MERVRLELAVIVTSLLLLGLYFSDTSVTGFASTQVFYKKLNLTVEVSQSFSIRDSKPFSISSFTAAGDIAGSGAVLIELDNGIGGKKTVFSNNKTTTQITTEDAGYESPVTIEPRQLLAGQPGGDVFHVDGFESCSDACAVDWNQQEYFLNVYVAPGTKVLLTKIVYTS